MKSEQELKARIYELEEKRERHKFHGYDVRQRCVEKELDRLYTELRNPELSREPQRLSRQEVKDLILRGILNTCLVLMVLLAGAKFLIEVGAL